jgi:hypothetical protein
MQTGDLVNLNDLVDWAMIFAVAFYLVAVVATELIRSLEATMRKRERRRRRQPHLQSRGRRAGRYALDLLCGRLASAKVRPLQSPDSRTMKIGKAFQSRPARGRLCFIPIFALLF